MNSVRILILLAAIAFAIGALSPVLFVAPATPRAINWLCLGLAFASFAWFAKTP